MSAALLAKFGGLGRSRVLVIGCASLPLSLALMGTAGPSLGGLDDVAAAEFAVQTLKPLSARAGTGRRMDITRQVALLPAAPARASYPLMVARGTGSSKAAADDAPLRIRGVVGQSLYRSARAAGAPMSAVQEYLRALNAHVSLGEDIHPGDEFDMVIGPIGDDDQGGLLYASLIRDGKPFKELLRWGADGQFQAADGMATGGLAGSGQQMPMFMAPVAGRITSGFGMRRHPILGFARLHAGMDFGAPWGAPIYAVNDGAVSFAGYSGGHGNLVKLDHGGGIGTGYAHMSRIAVSPGERVRKGQVIGYVGSTGLSTGPHLHYELYHNGRPVNPAFASFRMQPAANLAQSPAQSAAFKARLAQLQSVKPLTPLPHSVLR